jgi:hypothetical protein
MFDGQLQQLNFLRLNPFIRAWYTIKSSLCPFSLVLIAFNLTLERERERERERE